MKMLLPAGFATEERIFLMTDIHGRHSEMVAALSGIREPGKTHVVILGDNIDRGPDTRACLDTLRALCEVNPYREFTLLPGNHEQLVYRGVVHEQPGCTDTWIIHGGIFVFQDYDYDEHAVLAAIPAQILLRLAGELPLHMRSGNVVLVHAGVDPKENMELWLNNSGNLSMLEDGPLWIRDPFLDHRGGFRDGEGNPVFIAHGHTKIAARTPLGAIVEAMQTMKFRGRLNLDTSGTDFIMTMEMEGHYCELRCFNELGEITPSNDEIRDYIKKLQSKPKPEPAAPETPAF